LSDSVASGGNIGKQMIQRFLTISVAAALLAGGTPATADAQSKISAYSWVAVWEESPAPAVATPAAPLLPVEGQTLRQTLTVGLRGRQVRVTLTNAYGSKPLVVGKATLGRIVNGKLEPNSVRPFTFSGKPSVTVPVGAPALSDPVDMLVRPGDEFAISFYLPERTLPETYFRPAPASDLAGTTLSGAHTWASLSSTGDFTAAPQLPGAAQSSQLIATRLDMLAVPAASAIAVLGTTRTVGEGRWYDLLARRLAAAGRPWAVINASMVANALTYPRPIGGDAGVARFDRDVLLSPGLRYVIIADAANDIGSAGLPGTGIPMATLDGLVANYRQLVARAHARNVKVIAATVLPFAGVPFAGFDTAEKQALRGALNQWIRTSGAFDGVIDFDAMLRDPADPLHFAKGLDGANHFAPSEAGEKRMAEGIDLNLFRK
jgi:hypothetical protein